MNIRRILIVTLVVLFGVATGVVVGNAANGGWFPEPQGIIIKNGHIDIGLPKKDKKPQDFDALKNYYYARKVMMEAVSVETLLEGTVEANATLGVKDTQTVRTVRKANGAKTFVQSEAYGKFKNVAYRNYHEAEGQQINRYESDKNPAVWGGAWFQLTEEQFYNKFGGNVRDFIPYFIKQSTLNENGAKMEEVQGGFFKLSFDLKAKEAATNYAFAVQANAGATKKVQYSELKIQFIIDSNWVIKEMNVDEKYQVTVPVPVLGNVNSECHSVYKEIYYINEQGKGQITNDDLQGLNV